MGMMQKYLNTWKELLIYNDMETNPRSFAVWLILVPIAAGSVAALLAGLHWPLVLVPPVALSVLAHIATYAYLVLGASSRAAKVDEVLPDFLSLVASNIRAGLTPDRALIVSARSEFGPLAKAVNAAAKSSVTGMPMDQVMMSISERIRSNALDNTIKLIVEGLHSGGNMSELLEKTAYDLRKFRSVRQEISAIIMNYVMFIVAAITFGAPLLYGISTFLVDIMMKIKGKIGSGGESFSAMGNMNIFKGKLAFTSDGVTLFAALSITVTVLFGCMAIGVMSTGRRVDGLKYFPFLLAAALGILFAVKFGLQMVLGPMMDPQ